MYARHKKHAPVWKLISVVAVCFSRYTVRFLDVIMCKNLLESIPQLRQHFWKRVLKLTANTSQQINGSGFGDCGMGKGLLVQA